MPHEHTKTANNFILPKKNHAVEQFSPIYARITISGKRCEISTKLTANAFSWNSKGQYVEEKSPAIRFLNTHLREIRLKLLRCFHNLTSIDSNVTAEKLKNCYRGITLRKRILLEIIAQHNQDIRKLVGKDYTHVTSTRYETMYAQVRDFIKWKFKLSDFALEYLTIEFISDFNFYLKSEKGINDTFMLLGRSRRSAPPFLLHPGGGDLLA